MIYYIEVELLHFAKGPGCKNLSHPMNGSTAVWVHLEMRVKQSNGCSCSCTSQHCQLFHLQSFCAGGLGGLMNLHEILTMHCQFSNTAHGHLLCEAGQSKFLLSGYGGWLSLLPDSLLLPFSLEQSIFQLQRPQTYSSQHSSEWFCQPDKPVALAVS